MNDIRTEPLPARHEIRDQELPVDVELIDHVSKSYDAANVRGDGVIHVAQDVLAKVPGGYLPLASKTIRIEASDDDATIVWLPVFARSITTTRILDGQ